LIVDIQVGLFGMARDFDPAIYKNALLAHGELGKAFNLPVIMTTSVEEGNLPISR